MGNTDIFERMADGYDTAERIHVAKTAAEAIRGYLIDADQKNAIDFGCGTGLVGLNLLNEFRHIRFVDSSQKMIDRINRKLAEFAVPNADALCLDLENETGTGLRADYIFMAQVLLHIRDVDAILTRLYEALAEGGHLLIVDFDKNENIVSDMVHNGFEQAELADRMTQIGYASVRSETFYSGSSLFMNRDASMFILDAQKGR
ncbi:class I SAM-dependent methyltransferase [Gorillibacterium sp. sgz500922]|uniref:class I SAM-dependent methyltransferase n=1 Tax=Gorillibacterium sp. sgz500922 TaxID=3446694 RepID=UPI003F676E1F